MQGDRGKNIKKTENLTKDTLKMAMFFPIQVSFSKSSLRIQVCPKKGVTPTFKFFSDGIGARNILFNREGSGSLGHVGYEHSSNLPPVYLSLDSIRYHSIRSPRKKQRISLIGKSHG